MGGMVSFLKPRRLCVSLPMTRVIDTLVPCSLVSTILREDDTDRLEDQIDHHDDVVFSDPYFEKVTDSIEILYNGCFV